MLCVLFCTPNPAIQDRISAYTCPTEKGGWFKRQRKKRFYSQRSYRRWKCKKRYRTNPAKHVTRQPVYNISNNVDTKNDADTKSVFLSVLNIDDRIECYGGAVSFDSDSQTLVCDNSVNVHICRDKTHFAGDIQPCTMHKLATTGGRGHAPTGTGTVRWNWFDDEGVRHKFLVENVLYFSAISH